MMQYTTPAGSIITIREAILNDAIQMTACTRRNLAESPYLLTHPEDFNPTVEQTQSWIEFHQEKTNCLLMVAEVEGKIIAVQNLTGKQSRKVKHRADYGVAVLKEWQGFGIGTQLLKYILHWAKENPEIKIINLEVYAENTAAKYIYQKAGFVEEGYQKKAFINDEGFFYDNVIMSLDVS